MRQPRHGHQPGKAARSQGVKAGGCHKKGKTGLSPEAWERVVRLLISTLEPVAKLIDAISRLR